MEIKFYNTPEPKQFDPSLLTEIPNFVNYRPDFVLMKKVAEKFQFKKNIIVIGHGGSVTTFLGLYKALEANSKKKCFFVSTVDPDYITAIKKQVTPDDTVVMAISKSGETVTQLEALMAFTEFEMVIVTGVAGPLAEIAEKLNATVVVHPPIGGRYTGFTEVALLPAMMCGFNVEALYEGGQEMLAEFNAHNEAFDAASIFEQLEEKDIVDVFMPIYSHALFPFSNLVVQLCHESFGKEGKGQTYFAHEAPESQHHTNQRFFGGRHNIAGWFISSDFRQDITLAIPEQLKSVSLKDESMQLLDGASLYQSLQYEKDSTLEDAKLQDIPVVDMQVKLSEKDLGWFIAFWQMFAVYSSLLRKVNPFDQPQVEASKKISFDKRLAGKGKL